MKNIALIDVYIPLSPKKECSPQLVFFQHLYNKPLPTPRNSHKGVISYLAHRSKSMGEIFLDTQWTFIFATTIKQKVPYRTGDFLIKTTPALHPKQALLIPGVADLSTIALTFTFLISYAPWWGIGTYITLLLLYG